LLVLIERWLLKNLVLDRILLATEEAGFDGILATKDAGFNGILAVETFKKHMKIRVVRLLVLIELWLLKNLVSDRVLATEEASFDGILVTEEAGFHRFWLLQISKSR
jgi:hypothetical protein